MAAKTDLFDKSTLSNLRGCAEAKLANESSRNALHQDTSFSAETLEMIHELQVQQIELEMQNEELLHTQTQLQLAKKRYFDLYEMAPIGYFNLSQKGLILESNLAGASLLSQSKNKLISQPITKFIVNEDQDIYYLFIKNLSDTHNFCELRMIDAKGKQFWTHLVAVSEKNDEGDVIYRLVMSDMSEHKEKEALELANCELHALSKHVNLIREEERKHISREIHDELGQLMTALKIDLTWLKVQLTGSSKKFTKKVNDMINLTDLSIKSIRKISQDLRPFILDDLGLEAAMQWQADKYLSTINIPYQLKFTLDENLISKSLSIVLFRIYQEALTNIIRYAQAKKIDIIVEYKENELLMHICDDGVGISIEDINSPKSFGLQGMKERLSPWQGTINIIGKKEEGTKVRIKIPLKQMDHFND